MRHVITVLTVAALGACGLEPPLLADLEPGFCPEEEAPGCTDFPCAVDPIPVVTAGIAEPIRLVLVPEGYTTDDLPLWREDAARIAADLLDGPLASTAPELFQIDRVDLRSHTRDVGRGPRRDTLLGACVALDALDGSLNWRLDPARTALLAGAVGPADALVVVVMGDIGHAHARGELRQRATLQEEPRITSTVRVVPPVVLLERADGEGTISHELGHALVGLADEYADVDGCFEDGRLPFRTMLDLEAPNLTLDPDGTKWAGLAEGSEPGGARHGACVFHPTARCLMLGSGMSSTFCPVCADAVARWLAQRRADDRAPLCTIEMQVDPLALGDTDAWVRVRVADDRVGISARLDLDGEMLLFARGDDVRALEDDVLLPISRVGAEHSVLTLLCTDGEAHFTTTTWPVRR